MLHQPVLVSELLALFANSLKAPKNILDCSFGRGGHSQALLKQFPKAKITALDCDTQAIEYGQKNLQQVKTGKIKLLKQNFHDFASSCGQKNFYDLILMDLGVSSPQLDEGERGFSFYKPGPLDMRMDREQSFKASDIINSWSTKDLEQLFKSYGEIKNPYKVVRAILKQRQKKHFKNTSELAQLIQQFTGPKRGKNHPATPWFLALRMRVNNELEGLKHCLPDFLPLLQKEAYFVVITFHSLEDRIVKQAFRNFVLQNKGQLWNKKVIGPSLKERKNNPRSSSAKMRVFKKVSSGP